MIIRYDSYKLQVNILITRDVTINKGHVISFLAYIDQAGGWKESCLMCWILLVFGYTIYLTKNAD